MKYGDWESTIKIYQQITNHPRYGLQARQMLEIIPAIRSDPYFNNVEGVARHAILSLGLPGTSPEVQIWAEDENTFHVYIDVLDLGSIEQPVYVTKEQLIPTLKEYIQKLGSLMN